jgi:5-methylcytosine-specific restriction endonuclease McrA
MTAKGKPRRDIDNPEYRRLRAELLAEQPPCHWCKRATATTVDHVIEVDRGIDPLDTTNWVPACHQCNSRRGANYQARKKAATAQRRKNIQTPVFF